MITVLNVRSRTENVLLIKDMSGGGGAKYT